MESIRVAPKFRGKGTITITDDYTVTARKLDGYARWEFTVTNAEGETVATVVTSRTMAVGLGLIAR